MREIDRFYSLIFNVDDNLTEDANTMMSLQDNKSKCIRTILSDFVKVNEIVNDYTDIPEPERLQRFFGYFPYSGKAAGTPKPGKRGGKRRFSCQFILSPHELYPDGPANDALVMLKLQNNASAFIRALFLDFVKVNGIVENYASIPEKERLEKFFGNMAWTVVPGKQPGMTMRILKGKDFEISQIYEWERCVSTNFIYTAPDGSKVNVNTGRSPQ